MNVRVTILSSSGETTTSLNSPTTGGPKGRPPQSQISLLAFVLFDSFFDLGLDG
jgi:hypothetical protein